MQHKCVWSPKWLRCFWFVVFSCVFFKDSFNLGMLLFVDFLGFLGTGSNHQNPLQVAYLKSIILLTHACGSRRLRSNASCLNHVSALKSLGKSCAPILFFRSSSFEEDIKPRPTINMAELSSSPCREIHHVNLIYVKKKHIITVYI